MSKSPTVTNEQLTQMMGSTQEYDISGGDYRSIFNGSYLKMQLYVSRENRSYTQTTFSDTLYWEDYAVNQDKATSFEIKKNAETILGVACDELVVYTPKGTTHYYYNSKYGVDPELYKVHAGGNWYYIISKTKALPLKIVSDQEGFVMTSVPAKVIPARLDMSIFSIKDKAKTTKARW